MGAALSEKHRHELFRYGARSGSGLRAALPPEAPERACDLVARMLRFFPCDRITMEVALRHKAFDEVRSMDREGGAERRRLDLGFTDARVSTKKEVRAAMMRAVRR